MSKETCECWKDSKAAGDEKSPRDGSILSRFEKYAIFVRFISPPGTIKF